MEICLAYAFRTEQRTTISWFQCFQMQLFPFLPQVRSPTCAHGTHAPGDLLAATSWLATSGNTPETNLSNVTSVTAPSPAPTTSHSTWNAIDDVVLWLLQSLTKSPSITQPHQAAHNNPPSYQQRRPTNPQIHRLSQGNLSWFYCHAAAVQRFPSMPRPGVTHPVYLPASTSNSRPSRFPPGVGSPNPASIGHYWTGNP